MSPECNALGKPISGGGYDLFMTLKSVESVIELLSHHGNSQYGGEAVTQSEHALQSGLIATRNGRYTRIIRLGYRLGDNAEMCMIELVDFNEIYTNETAKKTTRRSRRGGSTATGAAVSETVADAEVVNEEVATIEAEVVAEEVVAEEVAADDVVADETPSEDTETSESEEKA